MTDDGSPDQAAPVRPGGPGTARPAGSRGIIAYWVTGAVLTMAAAAVSYEISFVLANPVDPCGDPEYYRTRVICTAFGQWIMHILPWIALALALALFAAGGVLASTKPKARETGVHVGFFIAGIVVCILAYTFCLAIMVSEAA